MTTLITLINRDLPSHISNAFSLWPAPFSPFRHIFALKGWRGWRGRFRRRKPFLFFPSRAFLRAFTSACFSYYFSHCLFPLTLIPLFFPSLWNAAISWEQPWIKGTRDHEYLNHLYACYKVRERKKSWLEKRFYDRKSSLSVIDLQMDFVVLADERKIRLIILAANGLPIN